MADFINTIDALGDAVVMDSIINRTITEFKDDKIETVGQYAFANCTALETVVLPNVKTLGVYAFSISGGVTITTFELPSVTSIAKGALGFSGRKKVNRMVFPKLTYLAAWQANFLTCDCLDFHILGNIPNNTFVDCSIKSLILRKTDGICTNGGTGNYFNLGVDDFHIYVPAALKTQYMEATNWSTYADQFRALEDYTVDGTTTGELDETKI